MKRIKYISIAVIVLVIIGGAIVAWDYFNQNQKQTPTSVATSSTQDTVAPESPPDPTKHGYFEISFAKQMIIYNQQASDLANIVQHGATDAAIKELADTVMATHGKAADQYAKWLNGWDESYLSLSDFPREDGHDAYPTNPGMPKVRELDKMATMSIAEKEKEFLRLLLQLHEGVGEHINIAGDKIQYGEMKDYMATDKAHYTQETQFIKNLQQTKGYR